MFKELKKILINSKIALKQRDYTKVYYQIVKEQTEEQYLKKGYDREFQTINKILMEFLSYLSIMSNSTSLAQIYKNKGNEYKGNEREEREKAVKTIAYLENILDRLEKEIKRMYKVSKQK